ncbi:MAG TPA: bifunctional demethylmenaquinone methyltransferase/2-methoxy-6-polyprenyl-1,4-benzoquinol methylase UbiE [Bacteroidales bacterium]|nr:bifunctional demethylmenaquinone methyltransferase/2-methoxy-6-polyprenyl-1,4-benzoquinol methylase UbiE [Bacteroidales bacterium]
MKNRNAKTNHNHRTDTGPMFDSIAPHYDFLNHLLSFGIDRSWRKKAIREISLIDPHPAKILDVATGTGDLAITALKLCPGHITGIDISKKMLEIGREKIRKKRLNNRIEFLECDSQNICFNENTFDVAMVAFGVRNFSDPLKGLSEMFRVLKNEGIIMVLEFSKPERFPFKQIYNFYFLKILPLIGRIVSKSDHAYRYLPESVMQFPDNEQFIALLEEAGFKSVKQKRLTGGVAGIYTGLKL